MIKTEQEYKIVSDKLINLLMSKQQIEKEILELSNIVKQWDEEQEKLNPVEPAKPHEILQHLMDNHGYSNLDLFTRMQEMRSVNPAIEAIQFKLDYDFPLSPKELKMLQKEQEELKTDFLYLEQVIKGEIYLSKGFAELFAKIFNVSPNLFLTK